ncbi:MAG: PilZ domain-containing protein [Phycisphaerae bacterium]|nr:PilZ domain-containing protein [Phycisphaerae bacterium]
MKPDDISAHARQFRRHDTTYETRIDPHPDHADQFRLSFPDAQSGMAVIDVSEGGLGLQSGIYLPRSMRITLHISGVKAGRSGPARDLSIRGIVRRCVMSDHKPTYQVGVQFVDASGQDERFLIGEVAGSKSDAGEVVSVGGAGVS